MARLWILSDIHDDQNSKTLRRALRLPHVEADVLVLAGDVCGRIARRGLRWILDQNLPMPIVLVAGNHDFWTADLRQEVGRFRDRNPRSDLHILDGDAIEIAGTRFVGATLWTDYDVRDGRREAMTTAHRRMQDFKEIRTHDYRRKLIPEELWSEHERQLADLDRMLSIPFDGPTVVVTHHAPSAGSLMYGHPDSDVDGAYASNLDAFIFRHQPELWIHGHVHHRCDYFVGETRVLANPRGYVEREVARAPLRWEESDWDPRLVVGTGPDRTLHGVDGAIVEHVLARPSLSGPIPLPSTIGLEPELAAEVAIRRRRRSLPPQDRPPAKRTDWTPPAWDEAFVEPPAEEEDEEIDLANWRP